MKIVFTIISVSIYSEWYVGFILLYLIIYIYLGKNLLVYWARLYAEMKWNFAFYYYQISHFVNINE